MASYEKGVAERLLNGGIKKLKSNESINGAFDYLAQGGVNLARFGKQTLESGDIVEAAKNVYKDGTNWNLGAIAGSYIVGSSAARVVTGGGATRDRNGNNDLIGIPFI